MGLNHKSHKIVRPTLQASSVPSYEYGPDVELQHRKIDGGPAFAEVIAADRCPSCGADWTVPGAYRLGHQVGREVLCWACWRYHRARLRVSAAFDRKTPDA